MPFKRTFIRILSRPKWIVFLGLAPIITLVSVITVFPTYYAFRISFFETRFMELVKFVGTQNYKRILADPSIYLNIKNTITFVVGSVLLVVPLSLVLALALNSRIKGKTVFRSMIIMPWVIAQIVSSLIWKWLLETGYGPISYLMGTYLGIQQPSFLGSANLAMPIVIIVNIWRSYPLGVILILSALQVIPQELYEAAIIDGASSFRYFCSIAFPIISFSILMTAILLTLEYFTTVTLIYQLTGGGPFRLTETLGVRLFYEAFQYWRLDIASTIGVLTFIGVILFSLIYVKVLDRDIEF